MMKIGIFITLDNLYYVIYKTTLWEKSSVCEQQNWTVAGYGGARL